MFARILKPKKPAKGRLFLSKKSTDDCYLIAVKNRNSSFIPEQRKKRLNNFLEICIHLKSLIRRNNNGLVSKKRICGVTSSTNFKLLLVYRFVVHVLFLSSFVSALLSYAVQASCNLSRFKIKNLNTYQKLQFRAKSSPKQIQNKHSALSFYRSNA